MLKLFLQNPPSLEWQLTVAEKNSSLKYPTFTPLAQ